MTCSPQQIADWQAELAQLQAAKTALLSGKQTVSVSAGDKHVEYRASLFSDMQNLDIRIAELKQYLGLSRRRALSIGF